MDTCVHSCIGVCPKGQYPQGPHCLVRAMDATWIPTVRGSGVVME